MIFFLARLFGATSSLVDNGQAAAKPFHVPQSPFNTPFIRADDNDFV